MTASSTGRCYLSLIGRGIDETLELSRDGLPLVRNPGRITSPGVGSNAMALIHLSFVHRSAERRPAGHFPWFGASFRALRRFGGAFGDAWNVWQTYCGLRRLRADQLARLGIERHDIARAAMFGRDRKR